MNAAASVARSRVWAVMPARSQPSGVVSRTPRRKCWRPTAARPVASAAARMWNLYLSTKGQHAVPAILMDAGEIEMWLTEPWTKAATLQRLLPDATLRSATVFAAAPALRGFIVALFTNAGARDLSSMRHRRELQHYCEVERLDHARQINEER